MRDADNQKGASTGRGSYHGGDLAALRDVARSQGGHFAAWQAVDCGFRSTNHGYYVKTAAWERVHRGIYRLAAEPVAERSDLYVAQVYFLDRLTGKSRAAFALDMAASLLGLGDFLPRRIAVVVEDGYREQGEIPSMVNLIRSSSALAHVVWSGDFRVTSPLRTIVDLLLRDDHYDRELTRGAFRDAVRRGLILPEQLAEAGMPPNHRRETHPSFEGTPEKEISEELVFSQLCQWLREIELE